MRIGITGIAKSGKTVFLTSLLCQLEEAELAQFMISRQIGISGFKQKNRGAKYDVFPFELYRNQLTSRKQRRGGKWPAKTTAQAEYHCSIRRKDWSRYNWSRVMRARQLQFSNEQCLEFFDFPGERIADVKIAANDDYNSWSDSILTRLNNDPECGATISLYLDTIASFVNMSSEENTIPDAGNQESAFLNAIKTINNKVKTHIGKNDTHSNIADSIIYSYKLALASLISNFKPLITPSTFLLDEKGQPAPDLPIEKLAETRISGLSAEKQFAPLPLDFRAKYPDIAARMATCYDEYRKTLIVPLFKNIAQSERLVILIDIPDLLTGGVGRYNDNRQILLDFFEYLAEYHEGGLVKKLKSLWGFCLEKIAFVAVKSDQVHPDDKDNLYTLLRQMTTRMKNKLPNVEYEFFVCSAVHSTRAGSDPHTLCYTPMYDNPENIEYNEKVSHLPDAWPDSWEAGQYHFAEANPVIPQCMSNAPKQEGLDQVFEFLIKDRS